MVPHTAAGVDRSSILADPVDDRRFKEHGYVVVPLVDPAELPVLRDEVLDLIPDDSGPFFSLYRNDWPELRRSIDRRVRDLLADAADAVLRGHRYYLGSLLVKYPGPGSNLDPHRDWTFVDESEFVSGMVWLPLCETDGSNGALTLVPGSHRCDQVDRGSPAEPVDDDLAGLVRCDTQPGDAVIFHNALIHGSVENRSDDVRIALVLGFVSERAQMMHFVSDDYGRKHRYLVTDDFPFHYHPPERPTGPSVLSAEPWGDHSGSP